VAWPSEYPLAPTTPPTFLQDWRIIGAIPAAIRERHWCTGIDVHGWPDFGTVWAQGTITDLEYDAVNARWIITDDSLNVAPDPLHDDGRYWDGAERSSECGTHPQYWVDLDCPNLPYLNGNYDIVLEYHDDTTEWWRTLRTYYLIRGNITGNTSQTITTDAKLDNWVAAKFIPSTDSLVGKNYYILRTGKPFWGDINPFFGRYPEEPNDEEFWKASVTTGKVYDDGTGYLTSEKNPILANPYYVHTETNTGWGGNVWSDPDPTDVLTYDTDGLLHRLRPTKNTGNTIFFGGLDHIPTEEEEADLTVEYELADDVDFSITFEDGIGMPVRNALPIQRWYAGFHKTYYGHGPRYRGDTVVGGLGSLNEYAAIIAGDTYTYWFAGSMLDAGLCGTDDARVDVDDSLDNDIHTPFVNFCSGYADLWPATQINKTIRGWQVAILGLISSFVRPVSYEGAKEILDYSIARCFYDCSINHGTGTLSKTVVDLGGGSKHVSYHFTDTNYKSKTLWVEAVKGGLRKTDPDQQAGSDSDGKTVVKEATTNDSGIAELDVDWNGATVYWSAGWSRWFRLLWSYFYPIDGVLIPDIDVNPETLARTAIFPPAIPYPDDFPCLGTGEIITRDASAGFKYYDDNGEAHDNGDEPQEGDVVRLDGDNFHDPGTGDTRRTEAHAEDLPFYDRMFEGKHPKEIHPRLLGELTFTVTSSTKYSITDDSKTWWKDWYNSDETCVAHSFEADSGSTTTFVTDSSWGDPDNSNSCWFDLARFPGRTFPFQRYILEVDKTEHNPDTDEDETVTYKLPVTNATLATSKWMLSFAAVDKKFGGGTMTVEGGDAGRIYEPDTKVNRFIAHRAEVVVDGEIVELELTHSDNNTLFFASREEAIPVGSTGRIIHYYPGGCWMFTTTEPTDEEKASGLKWQKIGTNKYFVQPTGVDPRGESPDWHEDMTENEPHHRLDFGLMRKGDYITYHTLNEMYKVLNRLKHVKIGGTWTNYTYWSSPNGDWTTADDGTGSISDNGGGAPVAPATISTTLIDPWISIPSVNTPPYLMPVTSSGNSGDYDFSGGFSGFGPFSGTDPFTVYELAVRLESVAGYNYSAMLGSVGWGDDSSGNLANLASTTRSEVTVSPHARYRGATQTWYDGSSWEDPYTTNPHTPGWFVQFSRAGAHLTATATTLFPFTADFYVYAHAPIPESDPGDAVFTAFDDNGDDVLEDQFQKFNSQSISYADKDKPLWSIRLGDTSSGSGRPAVYEPDLSGETVDETIIIGNGYEVSKQQIVAKFDVSGGLA
jgi:hypothetical protein